MCHRTQITPTDEQYEYLLAESELTGLTLAELVRRALSRSYGDVTPNERVRVLNESSGTWMGRDLDGEKYVENLRRGMARRIAEWQ